MKKENITYDIYCELRKELGEYTRKSNLPIEVITEIFDAFDNKMTEIVDKNIKETNKKRIRK